MVLIMEVSISANRVMARVLGIGVAVIISTWGISPFSCSASLWFTPNLCCSSIITYLRFLNSTSEENRAWVPMARSTSPLARAFKSRLLPFPFTSPVTKAILTPRGERSSAAFSACCLARSSVGAIKATCPPFEMMYRALIHATSVFPAPTSPWSSLYMGEEEERSSLISSMLLSWSSVRGKGREESKAFSSFEILPAFPLLSGLSLRIDISISRSSVKARVLLAFLISSSSFGQCTAWSASSLERREYREMVEDGRISGNGSRAARAKRVASLRFFSFRFPDSGYMGRIMPIPHSSLVFFTSKREEVQDPLYFCTIPLRYQWESILSVFFRKGLLKQRRVTILPSSSSALTLRVIPILGEGKVSWERMVIRQFTPGSSWVAS